MSFLERENEEGDGVVYELEERAPDISAIIKNADKPKKLRTIDRVAAEIIRIHAEKRAGALKTDIAKALSLELNAIRRHTRDLEAQGRIRIIEEEGKPSLYFPPKEATQ
jgi:predicted ArsR family transcriptional regulator